MANRLKQSDYDKNRIGFLIEVGVSLAWWEKMFLLRMEKKLARSIPMSPREHTRTDRIDQIIRLRKRQANDY